MALWRVIAAVREKDTDGDFYYATFKVNGINQGTALDDWHNTYDSLLEVKILNAVKPIHPTQESQWTYWPDGLK